jgi:beta-glucosidase
MPTTRPLPLLALLLLWGCGGSGSSSLPVVDPPPASLGPDGRAAVLVAAMTQDEKLQLVHGTGEILNQAPRGAAGHVPGIPRMGFPTLYLVDGSVGIGNGTGESTALPSGIASAATWDLDLAYQYGAVMGRDMRAHGVNVHLGGNVNLAGREPRAGRVFETKGEDPILAGRVNAAQVRGTQDQHVVACVKHLALNDQETGRDFMNAIIDERAARETDYLAFEIGVKEGGAQAVMSAYNLVAGTWCSENDSLLNGMLKGDWAFRGFVVSDWFGTHSCAPAVLAGLDMEMPGNAQLAGLEAALAAGQVPKARLDDMVHRIVRAVFAVGLYDHPVSPGTVDAATNLAVAQAVAEHGTVLLANDGLLPLSPGVRSIAVIGPRADVGVLSGGGSADVTPIGGSALVESSQAVGFWFPVRWLPSSPLAAIQARAPGATVRFHDGSDAAQAASLAASSDVAIVFASQWSVETVDRPTLALTDLVHTSSPLDQDALVAAVAAANPSTVVVLQGPGAQAMPWLGSVRAVLEAWYPGQRGAQAIAGILFGDVNPSGKLPITFPRSHLDLPRPQIAGGTSPFDVRYDEGLATGYRWFDERGIEPLFPFGFGLSYTTFTLGNATTSLSGDQLTVSVDLANTGTRAGAEVVQVYLSFPADAGEPRRLVGWKKVSLAAGASERVTVVVDGASSAHPLGTWSPATRSWTVAPGDHDVFVGNSSRNLVRVGTIRL